MRKRFLYLLAFLLFAGSSVLTACGGAQEPSGTAVPPPSSAAPAPTSTESPPDLSEIAETIAADVGEVMTVVQGSSDEIIFVMEEGRHDSRLIQTEIAIMLNRLYESQGLRHIGLEGLMSDEGPLDLSWAHQPPPYQPGQPITSREDVIVQTLQDGEIGAVEMMGLIYDDVVVDGIDDADLYATEIPLRTWSAPYEYLYAIAVSGMTEQEHTALEALTGKQAYEFAFSTDPFTAEQYAKLQDISDILVVEDRVAMIDELQAKVEELGIEMPPNLEADMKTLRNYLTDVFDQRSIIMAENAFAMAEANAGTPIAINAGAMHISRIFERLTEKGASVVVLRSRAQAEGSLAGLLSPDAWERKMNGLSVDPAGWLGALLEGGKKPPPTAATERYRLEMLIRQLAQQMAESVVEAVGSGEMSPDEFIQMNRSGIAPLPEQLGAEVRVTDVSLADVNDSNPNPGVWFSIKFPDGKVFNVYARVRADSKTKDIQSPTLSKRLTNVREELQNDTSPTPETNMQMEPQHVCSNTEAMFFMSSH